MPFSELLWYFCYLPLIRALQRMILFLLYTYALFLPICQLINSHFHVFPRIQIFVTAMELNFRLFLCQWCNILLATVLILELILELVLEAFFVLQLLLSMFLLLLENLKDRYMGWWCIKRCIWGSLVVMMVISWRIWSMGVWVLDYTVLSYGLLWWRETSVMEDLVFTKDWGFAGGWLKYFVLYVASLLVGLRIVCTDYGLVCQTRRRGIALWLFEIHG